MGGVLACVRAAGSSHRAAGSATPGQHARPGGWGRGALNSSEPAWPSPPSGSRSARSGCNCKSVRRPAQPRIIRRQRAQPRFFFASYTMRVLRMHSPLWQPAAQPGGPAAAAGASRRHVRQAARRQPSLGGCGAAAAQAARQEAGRHTRPTPSPTHAGRRGSGCRRSRSCKQRGVGGRESKVSIGAGSKHWGWEMAMLHMVALCRPARRAQAQPDRQGAAARGSLVVVPALVSAARGAAALVGAVAGAHAAAVLAGEALGAAHAAVATVCGWGGGGMEGRAGRGRAGGMRAGGWLGLCHSWARSRL